MYIRTHSSREDNDAGLNSKTLLPANKTGLFSPGRHNVSNLLCQFLRMTGVRMAGAVSASAGWGSIDFVRNMNAAQLRYTPPPSIQHI